MDKDKQKKLIIELMNTENILPLTESEFKDLKETISGLGAYLPENKAPYVWDMYTRLAGIQEPRPCMCSSAGKHWKRAVDFLHNWIKERQ